MAASGDLGTRKVPSTITDSPWVWSKGFQQSTTVHDAGEDPEGEGYVGKWMLFFDKTGKDANGLTKHDKAWFKIDDICKRKELYLAKAATAYHNPFAQNSHIGLICCYTEDYRNVEDVKMKAGIVRSALSEELEKSTIYYKTDSATYAMEYRSLGCKRVSLYRHTPDNNLWRASGDKGWDIID